MKRWIASLLSVALVGSAALAASDDEAFLIKKRDFKKTYKIIALAPVDASLALKMPDSAAQMIEEEVAARLKKRGYTVVPSSVLASISDTMEKQVGGTTIADTGKRDLAKARAVREHSFRELWFQEEIDALAIVRVTITQVPMESDRVEWDGAKQKITYEGRSKKYTASIAVSSVAVEILDARNKPIYLHYGGLEALMHRVGESLEVLNADKFFLDEKRIRKAAQIAVDPI